MEIAEKAFAARRARDFDLAVQLFAQAFQLESAAANATTKEPNRSVFFRSAATLAFHARLYREAERTVAFGLAGNPPSEIAEELREVFERVNFHRHLALNGVELSPNELQLAITGNVIASGMALVGAVFTRVQQLEKIIVRTAQRINGRRFGKLTKSELYNLYVSPPRPGSFAVTLRITEPSQLMLPTLDNSPQVIDEVIHNLTLVNDNRISDLQQTIDDPSYFESFLGLAKQIAPDGRDVRMVGLTASRNGREASVGLSVKSRDIKAPVPTTTELPQQDAETETLHFTGELRFAENLKQNRIKLLDDNGKTHTIEVSEAIAEDVARSFFGVRVTVDVVKTQKNRLIFRDINPTGE